MDDILFVATSPLGFDVTCLQSTWDDHIAGRKSVMHNKQALVVNAIENPVSIHSSGTHPDNRDVYFANNAPNDAYTKVVVENSDACHLVVSSWLQKEIRGNIGELKYVKPKL